MQTASEATLHEVARARRTYVTVGASSPTGFLKAAAETRLQGLGGPGRQWRPLRRSVPSHLWQGPVVRDGRVASCTALDQSPIIWPPKRGGTVPVVDIDGWSDEQNRPRPRWVSVIETANTPFSRLGGSHGPAAAWAL